MESPTVLTIPGGLRSITLWRPLESPTQVELEAAASQGIRWFDLVSGANAGQLFTQLGPLCEGLTEEMLVDLLRPDTLPEDVHWAGGRIRLASTFAIYPTQTK